jgi:hypothetical protein
MKAMVKKHEYLEYTFTIKVELNHKVEKRIDGIREHRIIIYNTLGAHNYCETHLAETANLQEIIFCMLEDAQKWVDKLNIGDKSQEQLILESMGFKNMKNIHTIEIPTLEIFGVMPYGKSEIQYQIECFLASLNVYITSNEYIGLSYYLDGDLVRKGVVDDKDYWEVRKDYKKIIMTTDPKLIKDGIQVIPNEFMEWFVKNPSCEEVEVEGHIYKGQDETEYKIIIPNLEIWKDIPDFEGYYQVSNLGNVKSLSRTILGKNDTPTFLKEKMLKFSTSTNGYYQVILCKNSDRKIFKVHSLVAICFLNHIPDGTHNVVIDHINEIKTDNRIENLRLIGHRENVSRSIKDSTSTYVGVSWSKNAKKWISQITIDGKTKYLGLFDNEEDANKKYLETLKDL